MLVPVKLPAVPVLEILRPALLSHAIVIPGSRAAIAPDRHVVAAIISACNYGKAEIRMNQLYVSVVVNGLMIGAVYALIAVGLNIIFGVMRAVNFAATAREFKSGNTLQRIVSGAHNVRMEVPVQLVHRLCRVARFIHR
jgi:ABC-type sulfate transport system permease subunit